MKIAVFTSNPSFLDSVLLELKSHHTVEAYEHVQGNNWFNIQNVRVLLDWCDVAYFDFCYFPLAATTHMKLVDCKKVVRFHGDDLYKTAKDINWSKIDHVILSAPMRRKFEQLVEEHPKITILPVGIETETFVIPENKSYGKKLCTHSFSIYWKKRIYTTIQTFYDLLLRDNEWELHIKGSREVGWLGHLGQRYVNNVAELIAELGIQERVFFSDNVKRQLWAEWLKDKDIFISNSIEEGFHVALAEAMAMGVYPVINCWQGASDYYSREYICRTQNEMLDKILAWSEFAEDAKRDASQSCRRSVEQYDSKQIAQSIRRIIELEVIA